MNKKQDLISRQAAIDLLRCWSGGFDYIEIGTEDAIEDFRQLQSAQPEQKKGHWIAYYHGGARFSYSCSQCGFGALYEEHKGEYSQKRSNFCPNCGIELTERIDE